MSVVRIIMAKLIYTFHPIRARTEGTTRNPCDISVSGKCQKNAVPTANFRHTKSAKKAARHDSGATRNHRGCRRAELFEDEAFVSQKLLASILFACALSVSPALAQNAPAPRATAAAPQNANALTPDQAKRALDTLQDDAKRAQMIDTLRAIANAAPAANAPQPAPAANPAPAPAPSPNPLTADSLGAQLLLTVSEQFGDVTHEVASMARTLTHFPAFYYWIVRTANDPSAYDQLIDIAWKLALVFACAFGAEWLAFRLIKRPVALLEARLPQTAQASPQTLVQPSVQASVLADPPSSTADVASEPDRHRRHLTLARAWQSLIRLPFVLGRLVLELLPVAVFVGVAIMLLGTGLGDLATTRLVIFAVINAYALTRGLICIARVLAGPFGLFRVRAETAAYIEIWARRIVTVGVCGIALANVAHLLGLHRSGYLALLRIVMLTVHLFVVVIILQCRRQVADAIRAPAGRTGTAARLRNRFAALWHYLAIALDLALWTVWALNIRNGYSLLLQYFVGTVVVALITRLATIVALSLIDRGFRISPDILQRFPGLEARANRYLPLLRRIVSTVIAFIGLVALLEVWGVDAIVWFYGGQIGSRMLSAVATIAIAALAAAVDLGSQQRADGSPAQRAVARRPLCARRAVAHLPADAAHRAAVPDRYGRGPDRAERDRRQCRAAAGGRRHRRHRDWFRFAEAGAGRHHRAVPVAGEHRAGRRQCQRVRADRRGGERLDPHHPAARG